MGNLKLSESQVDTLIAVGNAERFSTLAFGKWKAAPTVEIANRINVSTDAANKRLYRLAAAGLVIHHLTKRADGKNAWRLSSAGRKAFGKFD